MGTFVNVARTWIDIDQVYRVDTYETGKEVFLGIYLPFNQGPLMVKDAAEVDSLITRMRLSKHANKPADTPKPKSDLPVK